MSSPDTLQTKPSGITDFVEATALAFGYGDRTALQEWTIVANDGIASERWLAAWALLMSRCSGQDQVAVGLQVDSGLEPHPLLLEVDEALPAPDYLKSIERQCQTQSLPASGMRDDPASEAEPPAFSSIVFESGEEGVGVRGRGGYSGDTLERISRHVHRLCEALSHADRAVKAIHHLSEEERHQVVREWNPAPTPYPERTVQALFEKHAAERPDATALVFGDDRLSYAELNARANRLAHHLIKAGVRPGQGVATFLERGLSQLVSTLAILKAGAAYIPLDVEFPPERIGQMLEDAGPSVVLTHSEVTGRLTDPAGAQLMQLDGLGSDLESCSAVNPEVECTIDSLAYIMYTSGSTGRPKGVEVLHRGIVRLLFGIDYVPFGSDTVMLHMAAVSFDASTLEIWGPLLHGGTCVLSPSRVPTLETIGQLLAEHRVNIFWMTAALFNLAVKAAPWILKPVRHLLVGGEALSPWHVEKALQELPDVQLINGYGPTENTTFSTTYTFDRTSFDAARPIPIGRAIGNSTCYVLDRFLRPVAPGVPGELYVGGAGVARGYAGRPDLTAERFLDDPFHDDPTARMYKTGDMVYWNSDGLIEFIGRTDNQIKLRGFRIELQDIDLALAAFPGVEQAVTLVFDDEGRGKWLAAYVKVADPGTFPVDELKSFAYEKLPDYMVPAAFVPVEEWSYTPSGKLDRKALPKPQLSGLKDRSYQPPETDTEVQMTELWCRLLQLEQVGIDDDFFELGGDSLTSVHLFHEISCKFNRDLSLATLTQYPTIRGLASVLDGGSADSSIEGFRCLQLLQRGDDGIVPLILVHGGAGNVLVFNEFVKNLGTHQPVYAFQWSGWDGYRGQTGIRKMAQSYTDEWLRFYPEGPFQLGGYCIGGLIAIEMIQLLSKQGRAPMYPLMVWDSPNIESKHYRKDEPWDSQEAIDAFNAMKDQLLSGRLESVPIREGVGGLDLDFKCATGRKAAVRRIPGVTKSLRLGAAAVRYGRSLPARLRMARLLSQRIPLSMEQRVQYCSWAMLKAIRHHRSSGCDGDMLYFRSDCVLGRFFSLKGWWEDPYLGFAELCRGTFDAYAVGGSHSDVLDIPEMAAIVKQVIQSREQDS